MTNSDLTKDELANQLEEFHTDIVRSDEGAECGQMKMTRDAFTLLRDQQAKIAELERGIDKAIVDIAPGRCRMVLDDLVALRHGLKRQQFETGARVSIPTATMEQEFQTHYRRGFEAGRTSTETKEICSRCEGDPVGADGSICSECNGEVMVSYKTPPPTAGEHWIACADALPAFGQQCVLANTNRLRSDDALGFAKDVGYRQDIGLGNWYWSTHGETRAMDKKAFTHWMPIEEPQQPSNTGGSDVER